MRFILGNIAFALTFILSAPSRAQDSAGAIRHTVVYKETGRFAGWPANHGIWSWGDEIVCGFTVGYHKKNPHGGHDIDRDKPSVPRQARSLDGGETWTLERPSYVDENGKMAEVRNLREPIDFSNPNVALKFFSNRFCVSTDRCKTWTGPHELPTFGRPSLLARTDYIIEGTSQVTAFVAAAKDSGQEGQPLCIRTTDGGLTWKLVGWIGQQPTQGGYGYAIMPATVAVENKGYLTIIRRGSKFDGRKQWWIEAYLSPDDGRSWYLLDEPRIDNHGNPATLTRLKNNFLALAYGWRSAPYGIRARISNDNGQTWSREVILRSDSASWDIGYPRTVQRTDGKCVTTYYDHQPDHPGRYIACTIWDPGRF